MAPVTQNTARDKRVPSVETLVTHVIELSRFDQLALWFYLDPYLSQKLGEIIN
jgi:hypothetical protein